MNFPVTKYEEFQKWIPETDVDGVDAKDNILSKLVNADLCNGFIKNAIAPTLMPKPTIIDMKIAEGYSLMSCKYFYHSSRGNCYFYLLYKLDGSDHLLKFYVKDDYGIVELNIDEQNDNVVINEAPNHINYALVEDQLKINMNCSIEYADIGKTVVGNLSLTYLSEKVWNGSLSRPEGWYLFPRWLGWTINDETDCYIENEGDTSQLLTEDFDDTDYIDNLVIDTEFTRQDVDGFSIAGYSETYSTATQVNKTGSVTITGLSSINKIQVKSIAKIFNEVTGWGGGKDAPDYIRGQIAVIDQDILDGGGTLGEAIVYTNEYFYSVPFSLIETAQDHTIDNREIEINVVGNNLTLNVLLQTTFGYYLDYFVLGIDELRIYPLIENMIIVAKHNDGQRALVNGSVDKASLGSYGKTSLFLLNKCIDWRVEKFEIYSSNDPDNGDLWYLRGTVGIEDDWVVDGLYIKKSIIWETGDTTLNFNYGLGATVRVDNDKTIYSEITHRGRNLFVRNDNKVYMSHLAGSGRIQPDSFAYDENAQFGFFITNRSAINKTLSVTNLDEVLIITNDGNFIYYIEGSLGTVLRRVKAINGGQGIRSINTLNKNLDGNPSAGLLFWTDYEGLYAYSGGRNAQINVVENEIENYWGSLSDNDIDNAVGFYNKKENEYWVTVGNQIIIFELLFKSFKVREYGFQVDEFIGLVNDIPYIRSGNNIYKIDPETTQRLSAIIETHYNTGVYYKDRVPVYLTELDSKIMQEIQLSIKDISSGLINLEIYADGNKIEDTIVFSMARNAQIVRVPISLRYGKAKLKLTIPPTTATIRELLYTWIPKTRGAGQGALPEVIEGLGMDTGSKAGIGL
jgi:hypothetical protein